MNYKLTLSILIASCLQLLVLGQSATYTVNKASFSSDKYDEFSPVYYKNGIVFCTNRNLSLLNYSTVQNKGLFKINYIDTTGDVKSQNEKLLAKIQAWSGVVSTRTNLVLSTAKESMHIKVESTK